MTTRYWGYRHRPGHLRLERLEDRLALSGFGPEDGAYFIEPRVGSFNSVAIQPADQKIVAMENDEGQMAVARYDALGFADSTYGTGGLATPALGPIGADTGTKISIQTDGKAVVAGGVSGPVDAAAVARLNINGSADTSFGTAGVAEFHISAGPFDAFYAVSRQSSGKIIAVGVSDGKALVARWTASGALDSGANGFGSGSESNRSGYVSQAFGEGVSDFSSVAVQQDDKIVAVGHIKTGGLLRSMVARYTADGALDKTFAGSGYSIFLPAGVFPWGQGLALQGDGKIVVCGISDGIDGQSDMFVARYNVNGTLDASFGGGSGYVQFDIDGSASATYEYGSSVVIQPDGKIVVAGGERSTDNGGPFNTLVVRFNADGTSDTAFAPGGYKLGLAPPNMQFEEQFVALQADGSIIIAGKARELSGGNLELHPFLMRFFGGGAGSNNVVATAEEGEQSIANFAQTIFPGFPPGGSPDARFVVTNNDNALFSDQPEIDSTGTLTFTPAPNSQGIAVVTVVLTSGAEGEEGGEVDTQAGTFTIEVVQQYPLENDLTPVDVNNDFVLAPMDVLFIIDYLNAWGSHQILPGSDPTNPFLDTSGDNYVSPGDVLEVINHLNAFGAGPIGDGDADGGEGEGAGGKDEGRRTKDEGQEKGRGAVQTRLDDLVSLLAYDIATQTLSKRRGVLMAT